MSWWWWRRASAGPKITHMMIQIIFRQSNNSVTPSRNWNYCTFALFSHSFSQAFSFEEAVQHFWKCTNLPARWELDEETTVTRMSAQWMWSESQQPLNTNNWKQGGCVLSFIHSASQETVKVWIFFPWLNCNYYTAWQKNLKGIFWNINTS